MSYPNGVHIGLVATDKNGGPDECWMRIGTYAYIRNDGEKRATLATIEDEKNIRCFLYIGQEQDGGLYLDQKYVDTEFRAHLRKEAE